MALTTASQNTSSSTHEGSYIFPLILVTSLFFLWGLAYGLLDVLNKHFQETLEITKQRSTLLQAAYFGAYFLMAIPAGIFMTKTSYKNGIIVGLALYAIGAFLFYPSALNHSFTFFLLSVFVLASGLTFLETAANPYVTVLGPGTTSAFRLNLSQSFNGVGSFIGPLIGAQLFFGNSSSGNELDSVMSVYIIIGVVVSIIALVFFFTKLPEIRTQSLTSSTPSTNIFAFRHFRWAVIAQFFYVGAQVGMAALFINYCTEQDLGIDSAKASYLLSGSLLLFTIGRFAGTAIMKFLKPNTLLALFALANVILCIFVIFSEGMISIYALMGLFFFSSIMFPTIFALGVEGLGENTKRASSLIIMAIVGGAIAPYVMGSFASTASAYVVPLICFLVVLYFGMSGYKPDLKRD
jgi:MFS transporter, FHS family, L-fucose permease